MEGATRGTEQERRHITTEVKIFRAYNYWYLQSLYEPTYNAVIASTNLSVSLVTQGRYETSGTRWHLHSDTYSYKS